MGIKITSRSVPPGEEKDAAEAVQVALSHCNYPEGTIVVAVGKVRWDQADEERAEVEYRRRLQSHQAGTSIGTRTLEHPQVPARAKSESAAFWVVFVIPPGDHRVAVPGGHGMSPPLNWFACLVADPIQPFCTFGRSSRLHSAGGSDSNGARQSSPL